MEIYGSEGSLFVPDPNFFGGTLERAGRDGKIATVPEWDHPFGVPNQQHKQGMMANYRTAGLADMAAGDPARAATRAARWSARCTGST